MKPSFFCWRSLRPWCRSRGNCPRKMSCWPPSSFALSEAVFTLSGRSRNSFWACQLHSESGPLIFNALPWFMPFLWVVVILNSRGVARLILRPWRKLRVYGFGLSELPPLLTLIFVLGLEPFATRFRHYWIWSPTKLPVDWYGTPLSDFLGWVVTALLILGFPRRR